MHLASSLRRLGTPDFWAAFVQLLRACMPFDNVIVIAFRGTSKPQVFFKETWGPDVFAHLDELYLSGAYLLDPVYHFHQRGDSVGIYRLMDIAPDQFARSHYYEWYYGRIGITDEVSVLMPVGPDSTLTISMGKDISSGEIFGPKALDEIRRHEAVILALLVHHLQDARTMPVAVPLSVPGLSNLLDGLQRRHGIRLTRRQAEVALLILAGHSSQSIGIRLGISRQTVKVFRRQLYTRCNVTSQAELFAILMPVI